MPVTFSQFHRLLPCYPISCGARPFLKLPRALFSLLCSLITLLVLSSGTVYGEWMLVDKNDRRGMTLYVDPATISREANLVEMWALEDFTTTQTATGVSYLSRKVQSAYHCTNKLRRMLWVKEFSGNMGSGKVVYVYSYLFSTGAEWLPIRPDSPSETLWNVACGKR